MYCNQPVLGTDIVVVYIIKFLTVIIFYEYLDSNSQNLEKYLCQLLQRYYVRVMIDKFSSHFHYFSIDIYDEFIIITAIKMLVLGHIILV